MFNVWASISGISLGTVSERQVIDIALPADVSIGNVSFTKIAGTLPSGLRLDANKIVGTTFEVPRTTTSSFVIRANCTKVVTNFQHGNLVINNHGLGSVDIDGTGFYFYTDDASFRQLVSGRKYYVRYFNDNEIGIYPTAYDADANSNKIDISYTPVANKSYYISAIWDRTFSITVEGPDAPIWITPEGQLHVNPNGLAFVLDNTFIDFQLQAIDRDLPAGDNLEYFIEEGNGTLPPGLTLSSDGRITGLVDPIIALDASAGTGFFDTNLFDSNAYDFGEGPKTGLDSFLYDSYVYDFYQIVKTPRKLNRNYQFTVTVTDGETPIQRKFRIFVVGDDFLRADNVIVQAGTGVFTADNTYLRAPVWLTASNLGIKRANNYVTVFLDTFDPNPTLGPLIYELEAPRVNWEATKAYAVNDLITYLGVNYICISAHTSGLTFDTTKWITYGLPEGLFIDPSNGELFGYVPYQPAVTREYRFTVNAIKYDTEAYTLVDVTILTLENSVTGQNFLKISPLQASDVVLLTGESIRIGNAYYIVTGYDGIDVTGGNYGILRLQQNLIIDIPAGVEITKTFIESTVQYNTITAAKTFVLTVLGEVDSVINWLTDSNLGTIRANFPSILKVEAKTSVPNAVLSYRLVGGRLPPGLSLSGSGDIIGQVRQFGTPNFPGLTTFDQTNTSFDGGGTTFDREYTFVVLAEDQYKYSGILGSFTITVYAPDERLYSNIYVRPFQKSSKRSEFSNFINDTTIFVPSKIYRLNDSRFGVQQDLKMLIYAGIETLNADVYMEALSKNVKRKRIRLGNVKKAVAKKYGSDIVEYEVIYIEAIDEYEIGSTSVSAKLRLQQTVDVPVLVNQTKINVAEGNLGAAEAQTELNRKDVDRFRPEKTPITVDSMNLKISGGDLEYIYPSSIKNMRDNIRNIILNSETLNERQVYTENEFLPLWMLTPQDNRTAATGYIKAIPLCYCKPGEGTYILDNIINSGFDFTNIDYEIDRYILDNSTGDSENRYLNFSNYKYNV